MPTVCTFLRSGGGHCDVNVVPVNYEVLDFWHFFFDENQSRTNVHFYGRKIMLLCLVYKVDRSDGCVSNALLEYF